MKKTKKKKPEVTLDEIRRKGMVKPLGILEKNNSLKKRVKTEGEGG